MVVFIPGDSIAFALNTGWHCVFQTVEFRPPPVPYKFQTPNGMEVDLRLFNKGVSISGKVGSF